MEGNVARASITKQPPYQPEVTPRRDGIGDEATTAHLLLHLTSGSLGRLVCC